MATAAPQFSDTVSVIMPVFNSAAWIKEAIDSVLAQTFPVLEILVVDDGSTDNTAEIVQAYGKSIVYTKQDHRGVSAARNRGITAAKGDFIAFIDSDDYWHPCKIEDQIKLLKENNLSWASCETQPFDGDTGLFVDGLVSPMLDGDVLKALFINNFIGSATPLVKRNIFDQVGLFNEAHEARIGEDWDMWLRIASVYQLGVVYKKLTFQRLHRSSTMSSTSMEEKVKCLIGVIERATERDSNRLAALKGTALGGIYYSSGVQAFKQGKYLQARKFFLNELKYRPLKIESCVYLFMTLAGPEVSKILIRLKLLVQKLMRL